MDSKTFHEWITSPRASAQLDQWLEECRELDRRLASERDQAEADRRDAVVLRYLRRFGSQKTVWGGK